MRTKNKRIATKTAAALSVAIGLGATSPAHALDIIFTDTGSVGVGSAMWNGFEAAAAILENIFTDDTTVRVNVAQSGSLMSGVVANTSTQRINYSYTNTRNALNLQQTSAADISSASHLQMAGSVAMVTNTNAPVRVFDNDGSANNSNILMTQANAKALGLLADAGATDGTVTFSAAYAYDYDRSDGISGAGFDFIGVALHELATVLGFMSGVDQIDMWTHYGMNTNNSAMLSTLDLFRYSADSLAFGANIIDTACGGSSYFSVDGGLTNVNSFSTGQYCGNGLQASRWSPGSDGIMTPTGSPGQLIAIVQDDITALDVIGWEVAPNYIEAGDGSGGGSSGSPVNNPFVVTPEPATLAFFGLGLAALGLVRRRRG